MNLEAEFLFTLGGILLLGLATDILGRKTFLPRVTLLLVFGVIIGRQGLDLIPENFSNYFDIVADMTLLIVGFLIGGKLAKNSGRQAITKVIIVSVIAALGTTVVVFAGLISLGVPLDIAVLLGCIASATAPSATVDVIVESEAKGPFADMLLSIVALDDAWGLILFSIGMGVIAKINSVAGFEPPAFYVLKEIGGAIMLGVLIGLPAAFLTGRIRPGQPMLTEALGFVFLCGGLAIWMNVSFLIASMTMGFVIATLAKHHEYPFHSIENIEWPFMVIFFVLAGESLEFHAVRQAGIIGGLYILFRIAGKVMGAWLGCRMAKTGPRTGHWMGLALLPQAGVAIGMALVAASRFPEYRQMLMTIVISATIFFEIIGPIFSRLSLKYGASDQSPSHRFN